MINNNILKRLSKRQRKTKETQIMLNLNLEGQGIAQIETGIPFFDHLLNLFTFHGLFDLEIKAVGDIDVDYHHIVEDIGIVLGQALLEALGEKKGIQRYGFFFVPMDESLARVALDLSDRPFLVYQAQCPQPWVRDFNIGLIKEFFQAFANNARANVHVQLEYGEEPHHIVEAIFKAFGRALDRAVRIDERQVATLPTTKGMI